MIVFVKTPAAQTITFGNIEPDQTVATLKVDQFPGLMHVLGGSHRFAPAPPGDD
jgi:hypothetical protein